MSRRLDRQRQFTPDERLPYIVGTNDNPVQLVGLDIQVHVTGLFAETTQVLRLHNPNARELEGELVFPLPDGAVVCGYAIDVDGELADGVVVPKHEARRILEAEIRKGVDPGLVEHVQGNLYRTRIYPLPANGHRTVKLVYISALTIASNDAAYHLPLGHAEGVDKVSLRIEVSQTPVEPVATGGLGNLSLTNFESRWVAEAKLTSAAASEDLLINLPHLPDHFSAVEQFEDADYFCVSSRTDVSTDAVWSPDRVAILWDASGSRQNVERELELLDALAAGWNEVTFDVAVLRNVVEPESKTFRVEGGDASDLVGFLRELPRDGGTSLASADLAAPPHADDEAWLIFSDGLGTVGKGLPSGTSPRAFTITAQVESDGALLHLLAGRSGGAFLNLATTEVAAAVDRIVSSPGALRLARTAGCEDVHVYSAAGRMTVVGRLTEDIGSVYLEGPGAPDDQLSVVRSSSTSGRNIARAWAGRQAQVEKLLGATNDDLAALGRRYGLVTPGTSLLVLETLEQHLEYDIEPPASRAKMRAQFLEHRRSRDDAKAETRRSHIDHVLRLWTARVEWWEREHHATPKKRRRPEPYERTFAPQPMAAGAPPEVDMAMDIAMEVDVSEDYGAFDEPMMEMEEAVMSPAPAAPSRAMRSRAAPPGASRGSAAPKKESTTGSTAASVKIQPWSPDTPYLSAMRSAGTERAYEVYLDERSGYAASPAFFLDCADHFFNLDERELGLRVLSNLLELALDDPPLLRMYAWRMQQAGELDDAIEIFERVLEMRDDEPQSHRDLALALELRWQQNEDPRDAVRAMELLWAVITRTWDRFPEIELIALMELNRLIYFAEKAEIAPPDDIDERLIKRLDLDVRISMSWDADLTDVDLHVWEPTGDHAYYGHNQTEIGGLVSRDFTQGYGPEEYVLRRAQPGEYTIKTHYYGSHQQTVAGACTIIVNVFTNFARENEEHQVLTLRLEEASDEALVGKITIGADQITSTPGKPSWVDDFRALKPGMSLDEITALVGQPAEMRGSDTIVLIYRPHDDSELHITLNPRLVSVEQVMDGARLDILKLSASKADGIVDRLKRWWTGE